MNNIVAKFFFIILSVLILSPESQSQVLKSFGNTSEVYLSDLETHFERVQSKDNKLAKNFLKDFEEKWETGFFPDRIKEQIYTTSNLMLDNKMRAMPFFYDYLTTIIYLLESDISDQKTTKWLKSVDLVLNTKKNNEFTIYLTNSKSFFQDQFLFSNRLIKWKADGAWRMEVDSTIRFIFKETNLVCYTKKDSSNIYKTSGVYNVLSNSWIGEGGEINWLRANYKASEVYAKLRNYDIKMKMSKFGADSVEFYNYRYFDTPILGELEEQVLASRRGSKALFPAFTSYTKQWKIPEIFEDVDFSGGFKVKGAKLIGIGDAHDPVVLVFKREGERFITLRSQSFSIEPERMRSQYASITIHYHQDSIFHNGLRMNYSNEKRELSLIRDEQGLRADPFFNTFHQLDMFVEAVYWNMNEDVIDFDMIKGMNKRPAYFTSNNRYSLYQFNKMQGYDSKHPLSELRNYSKARGTDIVYITEYAQHLKMPYEQVKSQLLGLAHDGFVLYNADEDLVRVKDRTQFYLDARSGFVDYDVIVFISDSTKFTNAELKLDSFDLRINGVHKIILSDSQNLIIEPGDKHIPNDEYIVVGKNRNFIFNGKVTAGRFSFKASGCAFDYNAFKLDMPQIDSLWFWVDGDPLPTGGRERKQVQTALVDLSGDILIDHPANKSGLKPYKQYPIFNSKEDSYAYYDQKYVEGGVYTRDRFYFRVNPFGDKGIVHNTISLSNKGLRLNGSLDYLASKTTADNFVFYLDSMNVHSQEFNIQSTVGVVEYPMVAGTEVYQHWMPYQDNMKIFSKEVFMKMYDEETSMEGMLSLTPIALEGNGKLHYKVAEMTSNFYDFKNMTYYADTVNFVDDGWRLSNFAAQGNYNERKVLFTSNDGTSLVEFPENQYICYMDEATWYMDKDETDYSKKEATMPEELAGLSRKELADIEIEGSIFYSVHPNQDSLSFISAKASFNSRQKKISAQGVALIRVADAAIYPGDQHIVIHKGAQMDPLVNSAILANTTTKYHEMDSAVVQINGRKDYRGEANYIYEDQSGKRQNIHFSNIRVDSTLQTVAMGIVQKESDFTLSPAFDYYGDVHLKASRKTLEFDGGFRLNTHCISGDNWIGFKSIINPQEVLIPIAVQPRVPDISNTRKFIGVANSPTRKQVYTIFLENKVDYFDSILISAHGYIKYDKSSEEYRISSEDKLLQPSRPDNYISIDSKSCKTFAEGQIRFDIRTQDVSLQSYGQVSEHKGKTDFKVASALDFHFSEKAMDEILTVFKENEYTPYDMSSAFYEKVAGGFMGINAADKYMSKVFMGQQKKIPEALQHTIFINEMKMKWHKATDSYISNGKISIGGFGKVRINGAVDGYVEYHKVRSGDEFSVYFELGGEWFFFNYRLNVMQVLSSSAKFNEIIKEDVTGKGDKNRLKEDGVTGKRSKYRYILSTAKKKDDFLTRIKPYV
ncbi:MAG: hypothetical protein B7C24_06375 [Bacteroidetes bacterium 4572_77]|nr:MAG: hypothetical protein B7C24_06375 [Bacteroidetes bacterium 4572_77]